MSHQVWSLSATFTRGTHKPQLNILGFIYFLVTCIILQIFQLEKAASILSSNDPPITLAMVDANDEKNKDLATEYNIKSFPTLKIIKNGGKSIQDYKGPRDAQGIVTYLKKQSGPASTEIKSAEDGNDLVNGDKIVIVSL